ncbi:MAG: hypothetical protein JNK89_07475, partial [Saprospiraceae bacterium]|nr:hypothetical protein [Saprospiraceae bacterium]
AANQQPDQQPWATLFSKSPDEQGLLAIANDPEAESRVRNLASFRLLEAGSALRPQPALHGVVIEVGMEEGLDTLAAFADGTARYLNYAGHAIVWETPTEQSNAMIQDLWQHSINVVNQIGPWDKGRLAPPATGTVRLSFLVSGQLFFGQGPMDVFFRDPMAGPVLNSATQLMVFLTNYSAKK